MHNHDANERTFRPENAARLDTPDRLEWLPPGDVIRALRLDGSMTVADIGAGTGYFALPIAKALGRGRVVAVDFQPEMLALLRRKIEQADSPHNIELVTGEARATHAAASSCHRVLIANVWHELNERHEVLGEMKRILRPDGELAILDWRSDLEPPPGPPADHRLSAASVVAELERERWIAEPVEQVGKFSYMIRARSPR